ncbi:MAG: response regulator transcription factor [Bacteroidota bacterium]|nr:response regulator transcription factor [Bacteroidota bacterium]MDP3144853.1 response regulator transcription factor [Bacteroidota bacterium]MDP3555767.1 response regulator transcription factor [Bacteroidota bacterium]
MKILLIEDEPELRKSIKQYLHQEGYLIESASDFIKAQEKVNVYQYDCILVDITLPNGSGLDIVKQLKDANSKAGIIIISAKNSLDDRIKGLDLGADDYLPKPFDLAELNARIKALNRRRNFDGNKSIIVNEISIIPEERTVKVNDQLVNLTTKEYELLLFFISNKNRVVSKNSIAEHLWGDDSDQLDSHDFIYVHLKNLRKKLADKGCEDYVQTIYGIGYNFKIN